MNEPRRHHNLVQTSGCAKIDIYEQMGMGKWHVSFAANRDAEGVELRLMNRLVVRFNREEAQDFARAFMQITSS